MSPLVLSACLIGLSAFGFVSCVSNEKKNCHFHKQILQGQGSITGQEQLQGNGRNPWDWNKKFKCPSNFGSFPDPEDCGYYYACFGRWGNRKKCPRLQNFDKNKKKCLSILIAVCDGSTQTTTKSSETEGTTKKDDVFKCPSIIGTFAHPRDCTSYYSCTLFLPSLKKCPTSQLFDIDKKECQPANQVNCGTRDRPTDATTIAEKTSTESVTTIKATTEAATTEETKQEPTTTTKTTLEQTTKAITLEQTTTKVTTPQLTTKQPTTIEETTTSRVTAPDTDCDEDDVDCIIEDLGETPDWFKCPQDIGKYPHPTSKKLFIFCLNWKPKVKKCGQNLVFSEKVMTCIRP